MDQVFAGPAAAITFILFVLLILFVLALTRPRKGPPTPDSIWHEFKRK